MTWGSAGTLVALPLGILSAGVLAGTWRLRRVFRATAAHNRATDLILRGDLDGAEPLLHAFDGVGGAIGQSFAVQLATVSLLRGNMAEAEKRASIGIAARPRIDLGMTGKATADLARSIRAFARAAQGSDLARDDIATVRQECRQVSPLARVAVAELLLLSRKGEHEELGAALARNEQILEHAVPRERALVRGFQRMVAAGGGAMYRKPQSRVVEEGDAVKWLANVAPAVRGFVGGESHASTQSAPLSAPAPANAPVLRPALARRRRWKVLALWAALVGCFLTIWQLLAPTTQSPVAHAASVDSGDASLVIYALFAVLGVAALILVARIRGVRARTRSAADLESQALMGDPAAMVELERLARGALPALAASSFLSLARVRLGQGAFRQVLADAEAGLNLVDTTAALRNAYSDILVPGLHVHRGLALAGMNRGEEAETECAALAAGFPGYAYLTTSILRIRLLSAARRADFARANQIAQARNADMPITAKEELLCAMLAMSQPDAEKDDDENRRVLTILRRNAATRNFIRGVAPGLAEAVGELPSDLPRSRAAEETAPESLDPESGEAAPSAAQKA